ncbi:MULTISPECIES: TlpA disulfide reductase family protein [unclassified Streptomyces]|uniref:TlpA family protein disulfide reductase n=1 Tax=unclassified Streptomyces TaxID=2593676 RepID=UPI001F04CE78|nr:MULTISPECIES: TlpA disulfide reductase family protein [unclassified Streptomyces]MCH0563162.1 TlpA family protein disulfide reductase [Streptomyces sp. MUM 2J]MCH0568591.1 TlpA family protein disulfide reductase [Streptomyces sp. MUM 136J]
MSAASRAPLRPTAWIRTRRAALTTAGAAVAALLVSACTSGGVSGGGGDTKFIMGADGISTVAKGKRDPAPDLSGRTIDDRQIAVSSFKGKVVVLNVWGSWCAPCRAEAPNFEKVYSDLRSQGVQFVGINVADPQVRSALAFEKQFGVSYPSLYDPSSKLMLRFKKGTLNPQAIPSTLVLDRDGGIAARSLAALSEDKLRSMIAPVLAEK